MYIVALSFICFIAVNTMYSSEVASVTHDINVLPNPLRGHCFDHPDECKELVAALKANNLMDVRKAVIHISEKNSLSPQTTEKMYNATIKNMQKGQRNLELFTKPFFRTDCLEEATTDYLADKFPQPLKICSYSEDRAKPCRILAQQFYAFNQHKKAKVYTPDAQVVKENVESLKLPCVEAGLCSSKQLTQEFIERAHKAWLVNPQNCPVWDGGCGTI